MADLIPIRVTEDGKYVDFTIDRGTVAELCVPLYPEEAEQLAARLIVAAKCARIRRGESPAAMSAAVFEQLPVSGRPS